MHTVKSISRVFSVLFFAASLAFGALGITPAQAQTADAPAGLSHADWTQVKTLLPATVIDAQQGYLKASNTAAEDNFGAVIAISGDTLVVGAPYESSNATGVNGNQADNSALYAGAVYVFTHSGGIWSQQAYLKASNTDIKDHFGASVAISGDTLVVGALYESSNATGVNGNQADNSSDSSGAAYVFIRSGTTWSQQAYVKASNADAGDHFGAAVAISDDTLVVGAYQEDGNASGGEADNSSLESGAAYVFTRSGTIWSQQAYLKASNVDAYDHFGASLAITSDTLVVGAPWESGSAVGINGNQADNSAHSSGAAYVFIRSGSVWSQQAYVKASNTEANDNFGAAVTISGETLAVGANGEDSDATGINGDETANNAKDSGAAYVFIRNGSAWSQQAYLKASNTDGNDLFGWSLAISGDTLAAGAFGEDSPATGVNGDQADNSSTSSGATYVFTRNSSAWGQKAYLKASNTDPLDSFGHSVSISGNTLVMGASDEDSNSIGVDGNQTDNSTNGSGAAYVFVLPPLASASLPVDANPTNAASVNFTLTFSEPMTGVDASDLALTTTDNVSGASITGVSGGPLAYTVGVATGSGDGAIRLDVHDDDSILSVAENQPLGGAGAGNGDFTSGQVYPIDRTGPTLTNIWVQYFDFNHDNYMELNVSFSEHVTGVDATDFQLTTTGAVTGELIADVSGSGNDYIVSIETGLHIGAIRLDLVDNDSILDVASNPLGGPGAGNGNFSSAAYKLYRETTFTFPSSSPQDGWVLESSENSNAGGSMNASAKTFQLGDDASNRQYRAILSFNTASLPDGASIKSAVLNINQSGAVVGGNPFSTLGSLWADIRKGSFGTPALQLADFSAPASASKVGYFKKTFLGYMNTLTAAGRSRINKLGLTQFRLYFAKDDNNNHKADLMKFVANYSLSSAPTLTITYAVP